MLEPDVAMPDRVRWPAFTAAALDTEARAAFGFPLQIGHARIGALNLYAVLPGPLTEDQHFDALAVAEVVVRAVLAEVAPAPCHGLGPELFDNDSDALEIHQATGWSRCSSP